MTLLMTELLIVHSRIVHTPVSAPRGAHALSFRATRGIPHSEAKSIAKGDSSALARLRMTGGMRDCAKNYTYEPTCHASLSAERESGVITIRLRATRKAVTINGQGFRHGNRITRAAALVFFLVTFSKVKKLPGAGRNPASPVPRRAEMEHPRPVPPRGGDGIPAPPSPAGRGQNPASPLPPFHRYFIDLSARFCYYIVISAAKLKKGRSS
jgi:hypothetical protein